MSSANDRIIGESTAIVEVKRWVEKIGGHLATATTKNTVLILGESGVGKELIARALHEISRPKGPWIPVTCGAIPATLFESLLFGHAKGAFTGAIEATPGHFRAAHHGTLFLDEVGELPLDLQPKLLRVLQERKVAPVGENAEVPVDVLVIAATNRDLGREVDRGAFREDLFYRLAALKVRVPPLRDRQGDVDLLVDHFLGPHQKQLSSDAREALRSRHFPGNVRELAGVIESAAIMAHPRTVIERADLLLEEDGTMAAGDWALAALDHIARAPNTFEAGCRTLRFTSAETAAFRRRLLRVAHRRWGEKKAKEKLGELPITIADEGHLRGFLRDLRSIQPSESSLLEGEAGKPTVETAKAKANATWVALAEALEKARGTIPPPTATEPADLMACLFGKSSDYWGGRLAARSADYFEPVLWLICRTEPARWARIAAILRDPDVRLGAGE